MRDHAALCSALLPRSLLAVAAGCGGDDDDDGASGDGRRHGATGGERVSGSVSVDGRSGRARSRSPSRPSSTASTSRPGRDGQVQRGRRQPADRALDGGRGRQPARHRRHRPARSHAATSSSKDALKPIDFAQDAVAGELRRARSSTLGTSTTSSTAWSSRRPTSRPSGTTSRPSRTRASRPPDDWDDFLDNAETMKASGIPAYSIGGADGWTLTDLFENIYLRTAGPEKYDQLVDARDPVDRPVGQGRADRDGEGVRRPDNIAGGTNGALQTDFPTSVDERRSPTARRPRW